LKIEAEEGEQQSILLGLFALIKSSSFRQADKNILLLLCLPPLQLEMKTDSVSKALWYRKLQDSGMDNI